jgi:ATP-dependent protease ClpP protease subunit
MDSHATLMIHDVSSMEYGKVEEIKASAEETERLNQIVYKMMAKNCGHADDYFLELVHEKGHADWFLDANEAKKHGLVNHLRLPTLEIDVSVKIKMK